MILNPIILNIFKENDPKLCSSDIGGKYRQTLKFTSPTANPNNSI